MNEKEFENKMKNLSTPDGGEIRNPRLLKMALLNSKKSSAIGFAFIIIPCMFLLGVLIKYTLGIDFQLFSNIENAMADMDKRAGVKWISPLLLIGLPFIGIAANLLAITHFDWNRKKKELVITIKYKLQNTIILLLSLAVVAVFLVYVITENMRSHDLTN